MPELGDDLVTVVIPARDEEAFLDTCLDAVCAQDYPNLQIIVVDGGSTDGTAAIVADRMATDPRVEVLTNPAHLIAVSLNRALAAARGRWMVRVDAHSTIPPGYVRLAVGLLRVGAWAGVGGRKDGCGVTPPGRAIAAALGSRFGVGNSIYHHGIVARPVDHIPFGAYPTDLVRRLGGWNENLVANEDFEFDYRLRRAGYSLRFDPRLVINWRSRESVRELYRQYYRYGRAKAAVAALHPESVRVRHVLPPTLIVYLIVTACLAARRPGYAMAASAPYPLAVLTGTVLAARRIEGEEARPWVAPAFLAMHIGWGAGFWRGVLDMAWRRATREKRKDPSINRVKEIS
jgi:glycosyltransferase involved in cell wall biosynthesis